MPPKTRASAISETALEKLENEGVPGRDSDVTVKEVFDSIRSEERFRGLLRRVGLAGEGSAVETGSD